MGWQNFRLVWRCYRIVNNFLCRERTEIHQLGKERAEQSRPIASGRGLRVYQDKLEVERLELQGEATLGVDAQCSL